jgi:hypothetical protein
VTLARRAAAVETRSNCPPPDARRTPVGPARSTTSPVVITARGGEVVPGSIGCQLAPPLTVRNKPPRWSSA